MSTSSAARFRGNRTSNPPATLRISACLDRRRVDSQGVLEEVRQAIAVVICIRITREMRGCHSIPDCHPNCGARSPVGAQCMIRVGARCDQDHTETGLHRRAVGHGRVVVVGEPADVAIPKHRIRAISSPPLASLLVSAMPYSPGRSFAAAPGWRLRNPARFRAMTTLPPTGMTVAGSA